MKLPKIPVWCIPWRARKRIAELESQFASERIGHAETTQKKIGFEMALEELSGQVANHKRAIGIVTAWIKVAHKLDARAEETGLNEVLRDFPPK